jgi:hypothetical protein
MVLSHLLFLCSLPACRAKRIQKEVEIFTILEYFAAGKEKYKWLGTKRLFFIIFIRWDFWALLNSTITVSRCTDFRDLRRGQTT